MSQTESLRRLSDAANEKRVEQLAGQIETVRQARHQSAEELAQMLEPLAQAMAALTDETRQTLAEIERRSREQFETFTRQIAQSAQSYREAAAEAEKAAHSLDRAGSRLEWRHYAMCVLIALITAGFTSAFWLWLHPPVVQNNLDPKALAEYLKPAVIEALKPSRGR